MSLKGFLTTSRLTLIICKDIVTQESLTYYLWSSHSNHNRIEPIIISFVALALAHGGLGIFKQYYY